MYKTQKYLSELAITFSMFLFTYLAFLITQKNFNIIQYSKVDCLILGASVGFAISLFTVFEKLKYPPHILVLWKRYTINVVMITILSAFFLFAYFKRFIDIINQAVVYDMNQFIGQVIIWFIMLFLIDISYKLTIERRTIKSIKLTSTVIITLFSSLIIACIPFFGFSADNAIILLIFALCLPIHFGRHIVDSLFNTNRLLVLNGADQGKVILLNHDNLTIGNSLNDTIYFDNYDICSEHVKIIKYKGNQNYFIMNNDYFNRSWVNFRPIQSIHLKSGDIISIGNLQLSYTSKFI